MEIKATLQKPYTEEEYANFIVEQNHQQGYEIRETEIELQAWGFDDTELLKNLKKGKYNENDTKADLKRHSQEFSITLQDKECVFDTKEQTQSDLLTAFAVCSATGVYTGWVCNNGVVIDLTLEDLVQIQNEFKNLSNVYPKWNEYKTRIDNAQTIEEVEAIIIDYEVE